MDAVIHQISVLENVDFLCFKKTVKRFEKSIKRSHKYYGTDEGLDDYSMKYDDYMILLCLHVSCSWFENKLNILLLFMYSVYKLDGYYFPPEDFNTDGFLLFISETNLHGMIHELITDDRCISLIKKNTENNESNNT